MGVLKQKKEDKYSKGYFQLTCKEGKYVIRLIELCLDYPEESKISLIAAKEIIEGGYKESLRIGRKWTKKEKEHHGKMMKKNWKDFKEDAVHAVGETGGKDD